MWGLAGWTGSDDEESVKSLHRAVELGCNFFDTAWAYGRGHSEKLLGQLVRAHPDRNCISPPRFRPKISNGLPSLNIRLMKHILLSICVSMWKAAWKTSAWIGWI